MMIISGSSYSSETRIHILWPPLYQRVFPLPFLLTFFFSKEQWKQINKCNLNMYSQIFYIFDHVGKRNGFDMLLTVVVIQKMIQMRYLWRQ